MTLLEASHLHRSVDPSGRLLLDHVCLSIRAGDRLGIQGVSGSGKSTLLRALALMDAQTTGQICFRGQPVLEPDIPAFRRSVVYLPQQPGFIDGTVRDNLKLAFGFASCTQTFDEQRATDWFANFGRGASMLQQSAGDLSGGERQMVAFIRALLLEPTVLLLDEPSAAMDGKLARIIERQALDWVHQQTDRGFVWISHDEAQVHRVTNRRVCLQDGQLDES